MLSSYYPTLFKHMLTWLLTDAQSNDPAPRNTFFTCLYSTPSTGYITTSTASPASFRR